MAMSVAQAEQLVQQAGGQTYDTGGKANATPAAGPFGSNPFTTPNTPLNNTAAQGIVTPAAIEQALSLPPGYLQQMHNHDPDLADNLLRSFGVDPATVVWNSIAPPFGGQASGDSGLLASNKVPPGFVPWNDYLRGAGYSENPDATSIFVNPATGKVIQVTGGPTVTKTDPITGAVTGGVPNFSITTLTKAQIAKLVETSTAGGSGGLLPPGGAGSTDQLQYNYAVLAQKAAQDAALNKLAAQRNFQTELQNRAAAGIQLGTLADTLAQHQYAMAKDPGNFPAYLAAGAGMPAGAGSPVESLLGKGVQITPPPGGNPLADPRFQNLLSNAYAYAQPGAIQTVGSIAEQNGGTLPQAFYDYTGTVNPNAAVPAHAQGGTQMLNEPVIGIGIHSGQPKFLAGEAGPENIEFTPVHAHAEGKMPVPHQHVGGDIVHEHAGPGAPASFKHYAAGGTAQVGSGGGIQGVEGEGGAGFTPHQLISAYNAYHPDAPMADLNFTPSEATNISLGKALTPLGYVPPYVTQQLLQGRAPTPGSIDEATYARLPASLRSLLQAGVTAQLGSTGWGDYVQRLQEYAMPGVSTSAMPRVAYQ